MQKPLFPNRNQKSFIRYFTNVTKLEIFLSHLNEVQQASEAPGNRVEPFGAGIGPLWVNKLGEVAVCEVAVSEAWWEILLGDVASREVAKAQEVAGSFDVALLLRWEDRQPWSSQALLAALPAWGWKVVTFWGDQQTRI